MQLITVKSSLSEIRLRLMLYRSKKHGIMYLRTVFTLKDNTVGSHLTNEERAYIARIMKIVGLTP
ncbi:MAG: hypothetical protein HW383_250 [Candidatus Magasanikbacteria bacterium]|nr:hypothetical protein [Candidatus Magasanikbacteria bacterium]